MQFEGSTELIEAEKDAALADSRNLFCTGLYVLPPLYLGFWVLDVVFAPENKWTFLALRLSMVVIAYLLYRIARTSEVLKTHYILGIIYSACAANFITVMAALTDGSTSPYYAGLNLIGLAAIWFIPANIKYLSIAIASIYLPYLSLILFMPVHSVITVLMNISFLGGTVCMALFIRHVYKRTRHSEIVNRLMLKREVRDRELIIAQKTEEAITLERLSTQFSPQVVSAIKSGKVQIGEMVRSAEICTLFLDIVGSTDRVVGLDSAVFDSVLKKFMDDSYSCLLKYDLTIDKFLGDGILAFANEPVKRTDFVERTCIAAFEIRKQIEIDQAWYSERWKKPFEIRAGITIGRANVGFHGSDRYHKSYTAIGRPMALASRLCSLADPGKIVVDRQVSNVVVPAGLSTKFLGVKTIRGFEGEQTELYTLESLPEKFVIDRSLRCLSCGSLELFLDEVDGIYVMRCRSCQDVLQHAMHPN